MAKLGNTLTRVYLDQFNLSGNLNSFTLNVNQETPICTTFADAGPRRAIGNYDTDQSHIGFFEGDQDDYDKIIDDLVESASDHYVVTCPGANAEGSVCYENTVRLTGKPIIGSSGDVVMLNWDVAGSGGLVRGVVLGNSIETIAGQSTGINQGTTTSPEEYQVVFRVMAFTGTSITMKIQESQNDGGADAYADISGLTSGAISAPGVVRVSATVTTEAWKRIDFSGTFSSATILVTAGLVAGT